VAGRIPQVHVRHDAFKPLNDGWDIKILMDKQAIHDIENLVDRLTSTLNEYSMETIECREEIDEINSKLGQRGRRCIDPFWEEDRIILLETDLEEKQGRLNYLESQIVETYEQGINMLDSVDEAIGRARDELDEAYNNS